MQRKSSLLLILLFSIGSILFSTRALAVQQTLDGIAATVNNNIITTSELQQRVTDIKHRLQQRKIKLPSDDVLSKQVLQLMINQELEKQTAARLNITASTANINRAIASIAAQQKMTVAQLYQSAAKQGLNKNAFLKEVKQQIITEELLHQVIAPQIKITNQEIDAAMKMVLTQSNGKNEFRLLHILIPVPDSPTPTQVAAAKGKAQKIINALKNGESFKTLAASQSSGSHMFNGGDLGWKTLTALPTVFANRVTSMKKGDIAGPIKTANGFHIIKLIGTRGISSNISHTELRQRVRAMIMQRKLEEKQQAWIAQLRATAYIKVVYKPEMLPSPL